MQAEHKFDRFLICRQSPNRKQLTRCVFDGIMAA